MCGNAHRFFMYMYNSNCGRFWPKLNHLEHIIRFIIIIYGRGWCKTGINFSARKLSVGGGAKLQCKPLGAWAILKPGETTQGGGGNFSAHGQHGQRSHFECKRKTAWSVDKRRILIWIVVIPKMFVSGVDITNQAKVFILPLTFWVLMTSFRRISLPSSDHWH